MYRRGSPSETGYGRYPVTLELPAPLAPQGISPNSSTFSIPGQGPPEVPAKGYAAQHEYPRYGEGYDSDDLERDPILANASPPLESQPFPVPRTDSASYESLSRPAESLSSSSSHQQSSGVGSSQELASNNPFNNPAGAPSTASGASKPRGVSLVDDGPVAGAEGMRVVQRHSRRSSTHQSVSGNPPARSRSSYGGSNLMDMSSTPTSPVSEGPASPVPQFNSRAGPSLPPGAAAPRP